MKTTRHVAHACQARRAHWLSIVLWVGLVCFSGLGMAKSDIAKTDVGALPAEVQAALQRAKVPREALSVVLTEVSGAHPRLSHQARTLVNPASLMKLVTTQAAFDLLGPAYVWRTAVFVDGPVRDGVLQGNVYLRGSGDPRLTVERLWLLMRRLQGLGISKIQGDIVLDRSAFEVPARDAGSFDGEPLRPYNASPDALLINFKSLLVHFVPERATNVARVHIEPPMAGVQVQATVPLSRDDCTDYRSALRAEWSDPTRIRFAGTYPAACGEHIWPVAYSAPSQYAARVVGGLWQHVGGQLSGQVRDGTVPANLTPSFTSESPTLTEVVRDINKFSNNVMAQQVFLSLSLPNASPEASRQVVQRWWRDRLSASDDAEAPLLENGSGLSRDERISALALARLLQYAWQQPTMSELMSSLPVTGLDGTLKRSKAQAVAHLKTGSLRDVAGIAGYVDGPQGKRWVLVAILNHPNANAARPALEALVDWAAQQR
jgi:D-alanyl-D-alanine carboxypeptidase/D-alanyl-D-alanine-endopeptidase (penicillin-binding protein 4)